MKKNIFRITQMTMFILLVVLVSNFSSAALPDEMTSYYALQNTSIIDSAGSNDGTIVSAVTVTSSNVIIDNGMNFAGNDDYITFSSNFFDISGTYSVDGWFYMVNTGVDNVIFVQGDTGNTFGVFLHSSSDNFCYSYAGVKLGCGSETITDNTLHYFAYVRNLTDTANQNRLYIDGVAQTLDASEKEADPITTSPTTRRFGIEGFGTRDLNGNLDEIAFYDGYSLSQDDIDIRFNSGAGCFYTDCVAAAPNVTGTINITSTTPVSNSLFNTLPINFSVTGDFNNTANCSLILNNTFNQTISTSPATGITLNFTSLNIVDGIYDYFVNCTDGINNETSATANFTIDTQSPVITDNFINNSLYFNNFVTAQFNFTDNILLHTVNITIDAVVVFNETNINNESFQYNLSVNSSDFSIGQHELVVRAADGHTAKKLKDADAYNPTTGLFNDKIKYKFKSPYQPLEIEMSLKDSSIFDDWSFVKKVDRYTEILKPANPSSEIDLIVTSDEKIYIVKNKKSYGGTWLIIGEHWKDFVIKNEPDAKVKISRISDYEVEVNIKHLTNPAIIEFESTGDLNIVNVTYDFYVINMTSSFETLIFDGFPFTIGLNVDFNNLTFNISSFTPVALLDWNSTNFTTTLSSFNSTNAVFTKTFNLLDVSDTGFVNHQWYFNLSNLTNGFLNTDADTQAFQDILVNTCANPLTNFTIANLTYFDEPSGENINATNSYNLSVFDGTFFYNQAGVFNNSFSDTFCTNINPDNSSYEWGVWGIFTLFKDDYITRVFEIPITTNITLSNTAPADINLFLIRINESSTIQYSWLTSEFQLVDGTMRIFRCNANNTLSLVESTSVIDGQASANLELLVTPYSYDIIIDDIIFQDSNKWTKCHVESQTELRFFVDTGEVDIASLIALSGVQCTAEKIGVDSVQMNWSTNPKSEELIIGCLRSVNPTIAGEVEQSDNCSSLITDFTFTQNYSGFIDGINSLSVKSRIEQNGNVIACDNPVTFDVNPPSSDLFDLVGLFVVFILFVGLVLIYAGDGEVQLIGGSAAILIAEIFGAVKYGVLVTSAMITFLLLIVIIGRFSKK